MGWRLEKQVNQEIDAGHFQAEINSRIQSQIGGRHRVGRDTNVIKTQILVKWTTFLLWFYSFILPQIISFMEIGWSIFLPIQNFISIYSVLAFSFWSFNFMVVMITPVAFENIGAYTYTIFAVINLLMIPAVYFFFPETAGSIRTCIRYGLFPRNARPESARWNSGLEQRKRIPQ